MADFKVDHGFFDIMDLRLKSPSMTVDAFGHVDILNLDVKSG